MLLPDELTKYGLTNEMLRDAFEYGNSKATYNWPLLGVHTVYFYRKLHQFLKKWSVPRSKTAIGRFYLAIDKQLQEKGSSPYNTYKYIELLVTSDVPDTALVSCAFDRKLDSLQAEIEGCHELVQSLDTQVKEQQAEMTKLKLEFERAKADLIHTKDTLRDITNEKKFLDKKQNCFQKKLSKANGMYESTLSDLFCVEDDLSEVVTSLQNECGEAVSVSSDFENGEMIDFTFQTKCGGKMYSDSIRQLYYSLLADQIPPAKIACTIKFVLKSFLPSLNTDDLVLPKESCAGYMRREELKTVSMAHKAYTVIESKSLDLNSDGTTKYQKKLGGVAVNGMVLSLNEVPDGSADSMIENISRELAKLRDIGHALNLHNPERVNWTLFRSSTSDSAASQKRFNRLLEQRREQDEERFGPVSCDAIELVENLCAMHLGSNLRKAFLDGMKTVISKNNDASVESSAQHREHDRTDTFVHEFCKLFGTHGVPEYGCGRMFADYIALKLNEVDCHSEESKYYQSCTEVLLERQVGNRYFVSASNAAKILFLSKAAVEFLKYSGKDDGNNLERTLYRKLQDAEELARLKADAIMFYFVYAELVMLAKSEELEKFALDMNQHYLELQLFLQLVEDDPNVAMDKDFRVFVSEERLYSSCNKVVNHRIRSKNASIYARIFQPDDWDSSLLYPLLVAGATKMNDKLIHYAKNQLPGGKYWEAEPPIQAVLKNLKPNNDICESILGLNDYLTTAVPNMHQMTRSNLVEVKKNGTMTWYQDLPQEEKSAVTKLAVRRRDVMKQYCDEEKARSKQK